MCLLTAVMGGVGASEGELRDFNVGVLRRICGMYPTFGATNANNIAKIWLQPVEFVKI
jgi:hypothetical protein